MWHRFYLCQWVLVQSLCNGLTVLQCNALIGFKSNGKATQSTIDGHLVGLIAKNGGETFYQWKGTQFCLWSEKSSKYKSLSIKYFTGLIWILLELHSLEVRLFSDWFGCSWETEILTEKMYSTSWQSAFPSWQWNTSGNLYQPAMLWV